MSQSLTVKAQGAIRVFVTYKLEQEGQTVANAIKFTLQADRMNREKLYQWLEARSYRWRSKTRLWSLTTRVK